MTEETLLKSVGRKIKQLRVKLALSQSELAAAARTTQNTISRIENGDSSTNLEMLARIADALKTTPARLLATEDDHQSETPVRDALRVVRELHAALESGDLDSPIVAELFSEMKKRT